MSGQVLPSLLEYARFHGVASDHLASYSIDHSSLRAEALDIALQDPIGATHLNFEGLDHARLQVEKLDIPRTGALSLSSVIQAASLRGSEREPCYQEILPDRHYVRDLKVEPPVLATDHELDMRMVRERICLDRMDLDLPLDIIDDYNDEGLRFPNYFGARRTQLLETLNSEKFNCTREVLLFIQEIRRIIKPSLENWWTGFLEDASAVKVRLILPEQCVALLIL